MSKRKVLITSGNTSIPIDHVRSISNIFKGKTGAALATYFADHGCEVTLLTSHPHSVIIQDSLEVLRYVTYNDLLEQMEILVRSGSFDTIIHSSAVADYHVEGVYSQVTDTSTNANQTQITLEQLSTSGKVGSNYANLWMKLTPTLKIIDQIRGPWGFRGTLVKFKLQVDMGVNELLSVAMESMNHSGADFIVANTLETLSDNAYILSRTGNVSSVQRSELPSRLYEVLSP